MNGLALLDLRGLASRREPELPEPHVTALPRVTHQEGQPNVDDLSLYSPYDPLQTHLFLEEIEKQRKEVFSLFDVRRSQPVLVWLQVNAGMSMEVRVEGNAIRPEAIHFEPHGGLHGYAGGRAMVLQVADAKVLRLEDGREITSFLGATMYTATIRHELTHVATNLLGVRAGDWLKEGIAHAIGDIPVVDGHLRLEPVPKILDSAAALSRESRSIDRLLAWRQSIPPVEGDVSARLLSCALVVFLLEEEPDLQQGVLRLAAMDENRIRSFQDAWSAWLDRLPEEPGSASPPGGAPAP